MNPTDFFTGPPSQGPVGRSPQRYFAELPEAHRPDSEALDSIPHQGTKPLTREQVRELCRNPEVGPLTAYAVILAWGGRDFGNYRLSLEDGGERISGLVEALRSSAATQREDFESTRAVARSIPGLGISFYTKLLFFLRPKSDAYILDKWTAKSAVVLFREVAIRLSVAGLPAPETSGEVYEQFCKAIDACCGPDGWGAAWTTGEEVERTLFDRPRGKWRTWLKAHLEEDDAACKNTRKPRPARNADDETTRLRRAFAETLKENYAKALETGLSLPEGCGDFAKPNRLHVRAQGGFQFQFILNKKEIRAQLFLCGAAVSHYDRLVESHRPTQNGQREDFGEGITGNAPKQGATRAIDLPAGVAGGWGSPEAEWSAICESAVEAMATLLQSLEPHLP
jgi:hypothetical protein